MQILRAEPLRERNTLALPATAAALVQTHTDDDIRAALDWARAEGLPVVPLGEGSNVVLAADIEALVLCQAGQGWQVLEEGRDSVRVRVSAGYNWHQLVGDCLHRGWHGLENLALIPGQVGAAPIQNIGAYGVEVERFVDAVHGVEIDTGARFSLAAQQCRFGYRDSIFKGELRDRVVITTVDLALSTHPAVDVSYPALQQALAQRDVACASPTEVYHAVVAVRRRRLPAPAIEANAGSFFKNPVISKEQAAALRQRFATMPMYAHDDGCVKIPAAWLVEQAGWRGYRQGQVSMHPNHALVLVNLGAASGAEVLDYADAVAAAVEAMFAVNLEIEPRVYGR